MTESSDSELYERIEDLESQLSSMVSARDMTIRDLKNALKKEREEHQWLVRAVGDFLEMPHGGREQELRDAYEVVMEQKK